MSWLIESYLEEGKHGPDHPDSLYMKRGSDYNTKKRYENEKEETDNKNKADRLERKYHDVNIKDEEKIEKAGIKAAAKGKNRANAEAEKLQKIMAKKANERSNDTAIAARKGGGEVIYTEINDKGNYTVTHRADNNAIDAVSRHNRRHPEAKLESTDMIVETLQ